jgi:hypothetical protein
MTKRGEYAAIYTALVDDPDYHALTPAARLCFFNLKLILGPSGIDLVRCFVQQMQQISGLEVEHLTDALAELSEKGWLLRQGDVVWLRNGLKHNPNMTMANEKHRLGVLRHLQGLPRSAIVNAFASYYEIGEVFHGMGTEWVSIPYGKQVSVSVSVAVHGNCPDAKASEPAVAVPVVDNSPKEWLGTFMPMLRENGFDADSTDGSILKHWHKRGYTADEVEAAIRGTAMIRAAGGLKAFEGAKLSLRLLYARPKPDAPPERRPLWNEATEKYHSSMERTKRSDPMAGAHIANILGRIQRQGAA